MIWISFIVLIIVFFALVANFARSKGGGSSDVATLPYEIKPQFMTAAERSFYGVLKRVAPDDVVIFPQVRIADVFQTKRGLSPSDRQTAFNKISAKHFDFVICDEKSLAVRAVVELDDSSHKKASRVVRDKFIDSACAAAGLPIKHIKALRAYEPAKVRQEVFGLVLPAVTGEASKKTPSLDEPPKANTWREYVLHMSAEGHASTGERIKRLEKREPQVYVHVGVDGALAGQVIRIGRAKNGTFTRWFGSGNGHKNTLLWATGDSTAYSQNNATKYCNYLLFFAALAGLKTNLYIITADSVEQMHALEKELIAEFEPIWEQFRDLVKYSDQFPTLIGARANTKVIDAIAQLGMAKRLLSAQRARGDSAGNKLPDVLAMGLVSKKLWKE